MSLVEIRRSASLPTIDPVAPALIYATLTGALALAIALGFAANVSDWTAGTLAALPLVVIAALWISGGAATAIMGIATPPRRPEHVPQDWGPAAPTAILVTLCGEDPAPLARYLAGLRAGLDRAGLGGTTRIFVLSDTSDPTSVTAEEAEFRPLHADRTLCYRRRPLNTGRKPGNIADWFDTHGHAFAYMMVLDADSRMTAHRMRRMIWQIERQPGLGLLQAGIALVPGQTRFGRHQRVAARLLARNFGRGFAAWTGDSGNYWGHNAIMRIAAFRVAARLPRLSGSAPFGGDLLSHDFVEAAWIRRAGWSVALDPDPRGSAENAPQTLAEFHRRDRRWCQGNLQHLRVLAAPGLCAISRVHLAAGILSYFVAPVWLILVGLIAAGAAPVASLLPLLLVGTVLFVPKLAALADWLGRARTPWRRWVTLRAWTGELLLSSVIAPLIMLRQAGAVASVCVGRDCGWKSGRKQHRSLANGLPEMGIGAGLLALSWLANGSAALWLAPVALPLCAAPLIARALDARGVMHRRGFLAAVSAAAAVWGTHLSAAAPPSLLAAARRLAAQPYRPTENPLPPPFAGLDYDAFRGIRPIDGRAAMLPHGGRFAVDLLPPGLYFPDPVRIDRDTGTGPEEVAFAPDLFSFQDRYFDTIPETAPGAGFSGLRLRHPLNAPDRMDEVMVVQGASYFRAIGQAMVYGLSARAVAIGTGGATPEEFPRFTHLRLHPAQADTVRLEGVIDGPSLAGHLDMTLRPGGDTVMDIAVTLIPRREIADIGIAPLTSMYLKGPLRASVSDDFRPRVHDSDVLAIENGAGEWLWRPIGNPARVETSAFFDDSPASFGLFQSVRGFSDFEDVEARYHDRPNAIVRPAGAWGAGAVMLVEIPTADEFMDNIVAFWRPEAPLAPGVEHRFEYSLQWTRVPPGGTGATRILQSRSGREHDQPGTRRYVIDFAGDAAGRSLEISAQGPARISGISLFPLPERRGTRVTFLLTPGAADAVDLRLALRDAQIGAATPIWLHRWTRARDGGV